MKNHKGKTLKKLAQNLASFYPEYEKHFMCPTCLRTILLTEVAEISEAHIVPKKAEGTLCTYLCRGCNSEFGRQQDKWFGEYLRLLKARTASIMDTDMQAGHFFLDGKRVGGTFSVMNDREFEFQIRKDQTDPRIFKNLNAVKSASKLQLKIPFPLLKHRDLIDVGFLTAAYLMWFREFGYSWVLQAHLDPVREQIRNPSNRSIPVFWGKSDEHFFEQPRIGVCNVGDQNALLFGLANWVVLLPPFDQPDFYSAIQTLGGKTTLKSVVGLQLFGDHNYSGPLGLIFHDSLLVAPDPVITGSIEASFLSISPGEAEPRLLEAISKDEFEKRKSSGVKAERMSKTVRFPRLETGRGKPDVEKVSE